MNRKTIEPTTTHPERNQRFEYLRAMKTQDGFVRSGGLVDKESSWRVKVYYNGTYVLVWGTQFVTLFKTWTMFFSRLFGRIDAR